MDAALTEDQTTEILNIIADSFGVETSAITIETDYEIEGTLDLLINPLVDTEDALKAVETALAEALGLHDNSVHVTVDLDTGVVSYLITDSEFETLSDVEELMQTGDFLAELNEQLDSINDDVSVKVITVEPINANVIAVVDADGTDE